MLKEFWAENKLWIIAYVLFVALFWLIGAHKMTAAEAYFGLLGLHAVFAGLMYTAKHVLGK